MHNYYIDFETRSSVPIQHGIHNYLTSSHSSIICMGWKKDDGDANIWLPNQPIPFTLEPEDKVYAFHAMFDWLVWNVLGPKHGLKPFPIEQLVDVMALAGRYTLFQNLQQAGETLGVNVIKDRRGKLLIKKICIPPFRHTKEELRDLLIYCIRDVKAMYEIVQALPTTVLSPDEQDIWLLTQRINLRGVPIDSYAIKRIYYTLQLFLERRKRDLPAITDGRVTSHNQIKEIIAWSYNMGVELPNLTKATVAKFMSDLENTEDENEMKVLQVLTIRKQLALTSTAKYKKLRDLNYEGRIYDNLRYYGAATGRWAGMGAQLHNLPRAQVEDPEAEIEKFYDKTIFAGDPLGSAKSLIRAMICAPPKWTCDEFAALRLVSQGWDQYIDMAADLYAIEYDKVTKSQRALGKTLILGAGYNLGGKGFQAYAGGYGIKLTDDEANTAIKTYRTKYPNVVKYWYKAKDTMIHAIQNPGIKCTFGKCSIL